MEFDDIYWHDSVITKILIDRTSPGYIDSITFEMDWADTGKGELVFEEVYWANLNLNFGIIASESIRNASVAKENDPDLARLYEIRRESLSNIRLLIYKIELNSTGSLIKIIAERMRKV